MANLLRMTVVVMLVLSLMAQVQGVLQRVSERTGRDMGEPATLILHAHEIPTNSHKLVEKGQAAQPPVPCHCHSYSGYLARCGVDRPAFAALSIITLAAAYAVAPVHELIAGDYHMGIFRLFTGGIERPPRRASF
jgi:hypothetical protein